MVQTEFAKAGMQRGFAKFMQRQPPKFDLHRKAVCLDVLNLYRDKLQSAGVKKKVGWSVVRDEIMRPHDERKGRKILQRDERLVRQDLEAWSKTGSKGQGISDAKFSFIHDFVIELMLSDEHRDIEDFITRRQAEAHCRSIASMHQNHRFDKSMAALLAARLGRFLLSKDMGERVNDIPFRYVAIRLDFVEDGAIKATLAYLPAHPSTASSADIEKSIFCDGYLVPLRIPDDAVFENLSASGFFGNPLAFDGELVFGNAKVVRVLCTMLVLGQMGVGSTQGRSAGEATAFIDIETSGTAKNKLRLELPNPAILPFRSDSSKAEFLDDRNIITTYGLNKYDEIEEIYNILSANIMNFDFSVNTEYEPSMGAVFNSGQRGLLL